MAETLAAANAAQIDHWNVTAGPTWAELHRQLDHQIEVLGAEAIRALAPQVGERVLDIGCGCGQTTLALAQLVGPTGAVVGVDISQPMLEVARARPIPAHSAEPEFSRLDAQVANFGGPPFDAAFSRFGVMFFDDPTAAFNNIRSALKPTGRLAFVCWRPMRDNPWMQVPFAAALPHLPPLPPIDPTAPGPFAFADPHRLRAILSGAGYQDIAIDAFDAAIGGADLDQTFELTLRVGPLGAALREHPERGGDIAAAVRESLAAYLTPTGVMMPAAVWIVSAGVNRTDRS